MDDQFESRGIRDPEVLRAIRSVPRDRFVPDAYTSEAYGDHPLPIGYGQTISQPYIVAYMSELLEVGPGDRVLEVGTGSGYQAAVLAEMKVDVYSVEIIPELAAAAARALEGLGYDVAIRVGDGYRGWEEHAPYDGIIITAAAGEVPEPLLHQLAPGGRLVIPVGPRGGVQTLRRLTVDRKGRIVSENLGAVRFVPFTRDHE